MMRTPYTAAVAGFVAALMITGCSSSDETAMTPAEPKQSATEVLQKDLSDCQAENATLKDRAAKLEQDARASAARATDLESQLADARSKIPPPRPVVRDPRAGYESALTLFRTRNYADAASSFEAILASGASEGLEDNCEYWLGECAYAMKDFSGALAHFEKVFTFARSEKKDDAQMMIANSYHALGDRARAKAEYEKLLEKFPASPYAKRAKEKLAGL